MNFKVLALLVALNSAGFAQFGGYSGPGVMGSGAGQVGQRSGQQVDLRYYVGLEGIYDTGLAPATVNADGQLTQPGAAYGEQLTYGLYGTHSWRQALLGLDFHGDFRHYDNLSLYNGSDDYLGLGYTYEFSRRLNFNYRLAAGTVQIGTGAYYSNVLTDQVNQATSFLFDAREYFLQSTADLNFVYDPRTLFSFGGTVFGNRYPGFGFVGMDGYEAHGLAQHRVSKLTTVRARYSFTQFYFQGAFGLSTIHSGTAGIERQMGRRWKVDLNGGIYHTEVSGVQQIALDPAIAALIGQSVAVQAFYREDNFPAAIAALTGTYKTSQISFNYSQTINPGNGVYLTSRAQNAFASYSYTGIRKWNLGINAGYFKLNGIGTLERTDWLADAGAGFTYSLGHALHLTGRVDARYSELLFAGYKHTASRVAIGFTFSPGDVPLSLW